MMCSIRSFGMLLALLSLVGCASAMQRESVTPAAATPAPEDSTTKKNALPTFTYRPG